MNEIYYLNVNCPTTSTRILLQYNYIEFSVEIKLSACHFPHEFVGGGHRTEQQLFPKHNRLNWMDGDVIHCLSIVAAMSPNYLFTCTYAGMV